MAFEDIIIRMGMDASAFNRGLQSAKVQAKALNSALGGVGMAVSAAGLAAMAAKAVEFGSTISDLSTRLGISTDALQEFEFAAKMSGSTLDEFVGGLQKLAKAQADALGGNEETINSFAALGVSVEDLKTKRIEDIFKQIGRSVRDASDVQLVMADAMKVLGKASGPILAAMRNDLEASAEEARRLGLIIGGDVIEKLDALGDSADTLGKRLVNAFAEPLVFLAEIGHRVMDLMGIVKSVSMIPVTIAGAIAGGASPLQAIKQAFNQSSDEVHQIIAGFEERQRPRAARAPTPIERDNVDAVNSKMVQEVNAVLKLRERIAEMQAAELGNVEQRKLIEEQIAKLKLEGANDEGILAAAAARDKDIAAKEADLKSQKSIEDAAKVIANSNPVDAEGIEAKRKAELYLVELTDRRKAIETQITALKKEGSKANPEEIKALERQAKMLDLKKKDKALEKEQTAARKSFVELRGQRATAVAAAEEARGERLKFTLAELSGANLRNVRDPALREDIMKAREVMQLEQQGQFLKYRGGIGDDVEARKRFSKADQIRSGITNLNKGERFLFEQMGNGIQSIDKSMADLLSQAEKDGLNVRAIMAP